MSKIKIVKNAADKVDGGAHEDFVYRAVMRHLQGKSWPEATGIEGGVAGSSYVITDLSNIAGYPDTYHLVSKVVAVAPKFVERRVKDHTKHKVPISKDHMQYKIFLKRGLQTVRVMTPWADGFTAFVPVTSPKVGIVPGSMVTTPSLRRAIRRAR